MEVVTDKPDSTDEPVVRRKATFEDLLKKKLQKEEDKFKTKDIYVKSMDATLTFKKPKEELVLEVIEDIGDGQNSEQMVKAFEKLIYHCCDLLQSSELHSELGVVDPLDTVNALFDLGEKMGLGEQLMDLINIEGRVEAVKNL
ncbi:MAG: hypothetical protein AB7E31_04215 [Desulfitobacterium sp.]